MTQPRYMTEPMPVAAVPVDKMYLWICALDYCKDLYAQRKKTWSAYGVTVQDLDLTDESIEEMLMFLRMSFSDHMDWLGMSSEFIERHIK